jgi:legumain
MNKTFIALLFLLGSASCANWAVLVAGSKGFENYRHQADICHAYQTLVKGGIPAGNIIVFAYDDIALNPSNPIKGKIFNQPNGVDVYAGCKIDYKGFAVTPIHFLNVLKQNAAAMTKIGTGRVLQSGPNDKVFINFADHGAPGLIAFPSQNLYAPDLLSILQYMWKKQQYQELVFYLEACESGSMFQELPTNQKLYAVTAANADQASYASYCPPNDKIGQIEIGACLGDLFSTNWMEQTDSSNTATVSLSAQYQIVKKLTTKSHVMNFGDLSFQTETVNNFVGNQNPSKETKTQNEQGSLVNSRDVKLMYLVNRHAKLMTNESSDELNKEIESRSHYDELFKAVASVTGDVAFSVNTDFECYKDLIDTLESSCQERTSDYGLKYFRKLYNICASELTDKLAVKLAIMNKCSEKLTATK